MIKHRMHFFQRRWLQPSLENDLSFEIVNKINKIVLVLKAEIFIISFQTNLHAFFPPFLSCPYHCLCITFKSDIYKYVQLRIKTARVSVLSVLWLCYPWKQKKCAVFEINVYFSAKCTNCIYNISRIQPHNEKYIM